MCSSAQKKMNLLTNIIIIATLLRVTVPRMIKIIRPKKSGTEAVLFITPGGRLDGEDYRELGEEIQNKSDLQLWIVLIPGVPPEGSFPGFVTTLQKFINASFEELSNVGFNSNSPAFLGGHSFGGAIGQQVGKIDDRIIAVVLWGVFLNSDLKDYPKPVLTLAGELEGLARITNIVEQFEELQQIMQFNKNIIFKKPVIVLPGVNHGQFSSRLTQNTIRLDLPPTVSNQTALRMIATVTKAFMELLLSVNTSVNTAILQTAFQTTSKIFKPFLRLKGLDENRRNVSRWTIIAQKILANPKPIYGKKLKRKIRNKVVNKNLLLETQASVEKIIPNGLLLQTVTAVIQPILTPLQFSDPQTPVELAVKLITSEAIKRIFPKLDFPRKTTCKDINNAAFRFALKTASKESRARALKRLKTVPVFFNPDVMVSNQDQWLNNTLIIERNLSGISITSISFKTENSADGKSDSQLFCKLLSPYRALEIISIDLLRRTF